MRPDFPFRPLAAALGGVVLLAAGALALATPGMAGVALLSRTAEPLSAASASLTLSAPPQRSTLLSADGFPFAHFWDEDREVVALKGMSRWIPSAVVAIEDASFYANNGVDPRGMLRAALSDVVADDRQGASTITQQLVKNVLRRQATTKAEKQAATARTLARKLREARYAIRLTDRLGKDEILARYLNLVSFGHGAFGVQAAAETYFSRNASNVTLSQAALLAGLVRGPSFYDPLAHPDRARARRNLVLQRMADTGAISRAAAAKAQAEPLGLRAGAKRQGCYGSSAGYFCDWVRRQLLADPALGKTAAERHAALYRGGLRIRTTLDRAVLRAANQAVARARGSRAALATAVVQPGTGRVLALSASVPFGNRKGQTVVNLPLGGSTGFQAGSTFKAFVLTAALEGGVPLSHRIHAPQTYTSKVYGQDGGPLAPGGKPYVVRNAGDSEAGTFTLQQATRLSVNTYFVQLEEMIGLDKPARVAESLGVRLRDGSPLPRVPSFTLGTAEVSPLAMSAAYAAFADHGRWCRPMSISTVRRGGTWLARRAPACRQALPPAVADKVTGVLQGVLGPGGTAPSAALGWAAAGKTGTVQDFSSAWFVGYTPQLSAAVWMGDPRGGYGHPLRDVEVAGRRYRHIYGGQVPAETWSALLRAASRTHPTHF